jgi:hypothetical protein
LSFAFNVHETGEDDAAAVAAVATVVAAAVAAVDLAFAVVPVLGFGVFTVQLEYIT